MKGMIVTGSRIVALLGLAALAVSAGRAAGSAFDIYPLDNGVGRGSWTPERQALALAEIGFDGISYDYTNLAALRTWLTELKPRRFKLYGLYFARVTVNGATDRPGPGWDNYTKRLGEGAYDIAGLLRTLDEVHYCGPVGVQFYSVKGDPLANLQATLRAWRAMTGRDGQP